MFWQFYKLWGKQTPDRLITADDEENRVITKTESLEMLKMSKIALFCV